VVPASTGSADVAGRSSARIGVAVPAEHDQFQLNAITRTRQNHRQESPSSSALAEPVAQIRRDLPRP
jgi:hypothetical protein